MTSELLQRVSASLSAFCSDHGWSQADMDVLDSVNALIAAAPADCWCETCRPITLNDMRMVLCPTCGNKRCPHATDHRNACTNSNKPGQAGSSYANCAPAAPAVQPLTDEQIDAISLRDGGITYRQLARAIEAHNGIAAPGSADHD